MSEEQEQQGDEPVSGGKPAMERDVVRLDERLGAIEDFAVVAKEGIKNLNANMTFMRERMDKLDAGLSRLAEVVTAPEPTDPDQSLQIDKLMTALAAAQGEMRNPDASRIVTVKLNSGGGYTHKYATLAGHLAIAREALSKHGIAITQRVTTVAEGNNVRWVLLTRIDGHGQWMQARWPLSAPSDNIQAWGGQLTYRKRYALAAFLGLASDEEDDDAGAEHVGRGDASSSRATTPRAERRELTPEQARAQEGKGALQHHLEKLQAELVKLRAEGGTPESLEAARTVWSQYAEPLEQAYREFPKTVDTMVSRFRTAFGNPPPIPGVKYPPAPARGGDTLV